MDFKGFIKDNSDALVQLGAGLLSGRTASDQIGQGLTGFGNARKEAKAQNATLSWLQQNDPELGQLMASGAITPTDAFKMAYQKRLQSQKPKSYDFQTLPNGDYGTFDSTTGELNIIGHAPKSGSAAFETVTPDTAANYGLPKGYYQRNSASGEVKPLKVDDPNAPPSLTATDKKAIMEADDQVLTNQNAIDNLTAAEKISPDANSGYFAGARATLGNNLPDFLVPDSVSSPQSSQATSEYDNLVMNGALGQLRSIFGGNPTEGERAVLLDLQASSSKPPEVRRRILQRAKELAQIRLDFNRQRASELRGGTYYQPQGGSAAGKTSSGISFTVEP